MIRCRTNQILIDRQVSTIYNTNRTLALLCSFLPSRRRRFLDNRMPSVVSHREHFGLLATIISAVPYGIIIVLAGNCFLLLQKKRGIYSNRRRLFLILYVTVVFFLSTWSIIQSIRNIMLFIFPELRNPPFQISFAWSPVTQALPPTVWVADGFMVIILLNRAPAE